MQSVVPFTLAMALACAAGAASAQDASTCTGGWPACGADRIVGTQEISQQLLHAGQATRIDMTGGTSGRKFVLLLRPDGKLDLSGGGGNIGRDWKLEDGKLCLRAYQNLWGGQYNCGTLEVRSGTAYWVEPAGNSRNRIDAVSFAQP